MELRDQHISRQVDLIPPQILDEQITVIGGGTIGSFTTLALAKMGFRKIAVIDFDRVDIVNMSCQFFGFQDIGKPKVLALKESIETMTNKETIIEPIFDRWTGAKFSGIVVSAVDSLETRKEIWDAHVGNESTKIVVDARMGAEVASLYAVDPNSPRDKVAYPKTLTSDSEAVREPCTAKSTTYTAIIISGIVAQTIRDVLMHKNYTRIMLYSIRDSKMTAFPVSFDPNS